MNEHRIGRPIDAELLNLRRCHSQRAIVRNQTPRCASAQHDCRDISDAGVDEQIFLRSDLRNRGHRPAGLPQSVVHIGQDLAGVRSNSLAEHGDGFLRCFGRSIAVPKAVDKQRQRASGVWWMHQPSPQTRSPG